MNDPTTETTILQSLEQPMQSIDEVRDHAKALTKLVEWTSVGVLYDNVNGPSAVLVVLLDMSHNVVAVCRFCLNPENSVLALQSYAKKSTTIELCCSGKRSLGSDEVVDLPILTEIWNKTKPTQVPLAETQRFFEDLENDLKKRYARQKISKNTKQQVIFDAHGRCMFEGCGKDLMVDETTGQRGNFSYLAHNIAASERGPRGIFYLSKLLADDPSNILLLCDVHHRLIDLVARGDYPAERLTDMRTRFCRDANQLLDSLTLPRISAFCVCWPVHRQVISIPTPTQIAEALVPIGARLDGNLSMLNDNEKLLRDSDPEQMWQMMPQAIESTAKDILGRSHHKSYHVALFAMGLMPALIALGALLGNKTAITPMLFHRESSLWYWPNERPNENFFGVSGLDDLDENCNEIILELTLTAHPKSMSTTATSLGYPVVSVQANTSVLGNGALGHPDDGRLFRNRMQQLLHLLRDAHNVQTIHLLPCASNAACVFLGQAYDSYHPQLIIYDFSDNGSSMTERLIVANRNNKCEVSACLTDA